MNQKHAENARVGDKLKQQHVCSQTKETALPTLQTALCTEILMIAVITLIVFSAIFGFALRKGYVVIEATDEADHDESAEYYTI